MSPTRIYITSGLAIMLLYAAAVFAGDSPDDIKKRIGAGNPVAGKEKSAMCQGCHGEDGNSATADFPKLAGQYAAYIQKQIRDFQSGSRNDPVMSGMAATVTDNHDLLDISAYFASQKQMKGDTPVINPAGKEWYMSDNGCANCHGENGKGAGPGNPDAPVIGGQHKDYLIKQLKAFASGARKNEPSGMMAMIAGMMSDEEMENVTSYISGM
jgi:cytochrome c553